jgi:hypothetical protein
MRCAIIWQSIRNFIAGLLGGAGRRGMRTSSKEGSQTKGLEHHDG